MRVLAFRSHASSAHTHMHTHTHAADTTMRVSLRPQNGISETMKSLFIVESAHTDIIGDVGQKGLD